MVVCIFEHAQWGWARNDSLALGDVQVSDIPHANQQGKSLARVIGASYYMRSLIQSPIQTST
jgi:hypothetical protein